eukprot:TRINITY_DN1333_c3_g1_i1.p1 TRINITY_DN1333_c3_g1~~TRINITY_DN1333_c3_g1_i1.p1  ORF type:complete len:263 (+),score=77.26 TRINITY_DN1333_c3_g1_i1:48-791(+)
MATKRASDTLTNQNNQNETENDENETENNKNKTQSKRSKINQPNFKFYSGKCKSKPNGDTIDKIHTNWSKNYELLEEHHSYIQWLFPVYESSGVNFEAKPLTYEEAKKIRENIECSTRVLKSYKMMLNFYGFKLVDKENGKIKKSDEWEDRFDNLNQNQHNSLRINRILTSLGELGFERYKQPFLEKFKRQLDKKRLLECKYSYENFWIKCLETDTEEYINKTKERNDNDRGTSILFEKSNNLDQNQ